MSEMIPCPFCGNDVIGVSYNDKEISPAKWCAVCYNCGAHGPYRNTSTEALEAWNHRFAADKNVGSKERTAKVEMLEELSKTSMIWEGKCSNCGSYTIHEMNYCFGCGAKLYWGK